MSNMLIRIKNIEKEVKINNICNIIKSIVVGIVIVTCLVLSAYNW